MSNKKKNIPYGILQTRSNKNTESHVQHIYFFNVMTELCHVKHPSRGHGRSSGGNNIKKKRKRSGHFEWGPGHAEVKTPPARKSGDQDITRPGVTNQLN